MTDQEVERFARHIALKEIGGAGQRQLSQTTIAVVGVGGIGGPAALALAAAGTGELILIDDDKVTLSNLPRQTLFTEADLGQEKAKIARLKLLQGYPNTQIIGHCERLNGSNINRLVDSAQLIIDACDNFATRLLVNQFCVARGKMLVWASAAGWQGQSGQYIPGTIPASPCYQCFVGDLKTIDDEGDDCARYGVAAPLTGLMGQLTALKAIRLLAVAPGTAPADTQKIDLVDGFSLSWRSILMRPDPACTICA